jgi:peptidoglycan/LPS O-acetylase OafA/YrhL
MTLFFVLSGFVIHYNYAALVSRGRFGGIAAYLWARFARLYPLFLLLLLGYLLVSRRHYEFWRGHPEEFETVLRALPYFLFSVQSWLYLPIDGHALVYAIGGSSSLTWSISTEWFFYFLYPCMAWLILRAQTPQLTALVIGLWCALWIVVTAGLYDRAPSINAWAVAHYGPIAEMREPQDQFAAEQSFVRWLLYFSPYLRLGEFVLGSLVAQLYIQLRSRKPGDTENLAGTILFAGAAVSVAAITYLEYSPDVAENIFRKMYMNFALAPSAAVLIFCAARYRNVFSQLLTSQPALKLGDASYSIYLVHFLVLMAVFKFIGPSAHGVVFDGLTLVLAIAAVLAISVLLYSYYEAPARNWLRRLWRGGGATVGMTAQRPHSAS